MWRPATLINIVILFRTLCIYQHSTSFVWNDSYFIRFRRNSCKYVIYKNARVASEMCYFYVLSDETRAIKIMKLVGREKEQDILQQAIASESSQLIAVYGRRRVGKTYLIENTLSREIIFDATGIKETSIRTQISNFQAQIIKRSKKLSKSPTPQNWLEAFQLSLIHISEPTRPY